MRKPAFRKCENKDADQLRGYCEADQRLCFRYRDSTISDFADESTTIGDNCRIEVVFSFENT